MLLWDISCVSRWTRGVFPIMPDPTGLCHTSNSEGILFQDVVQKSSSFITAKAQVGIRRTAAKELKCLLFINFVRSHRRQWQTETRNGVFLLPEKVATKVLNIAVKFSTNPHSFLAGL